MADATGAGTPIDPAEARVEALALKLLRSPAENGLESGDLDSARLIARRRLEDSEARTNDPATFDPEHEDAIRRTSGETSASGDTITKRTPVAD